MKKWRWILLPLILCFFTGCSKVSSADANLISVDKDGAITSAIIEPFDKDYYDKEELKQNIEDAIDAYNTQAGDEAIRMKSFKIRKDTAYVIMKYASYKDYTEFNQAPIFVGTVQEAIAAGYDTAENLSKTGENLLTTMQELAASEDTYHVVVVKEPLQVETPGNILFTSDFVAVPEKKLAEVQADEKTAVMLDEYAYIIYK